MKRFLTFLCALLLVQPLSWGHPSWQIHVKEMYSVFPFAMDPNGGIVPENKPIGDWLKTISSDLIDKYKGVPMEEFGGLTFYEYIGSEFDFHCKHRLLFHWGYNSNPWSEALSQKAAYLSPLELERLQDAFRLEQKRRNAEANALTEKTFGLASGGTEAAWANALISIAYDVHLLGDYTPEDNSDFDGVTPPGAVAGDVINSLRKLDPKLSKPLVNTLKRITLNYSGDPHAMASQLIVALQEQLPGLILKAQGGSLARRFRKLGYKLR